MSTLLSICIPTYNRPAWLKRALESITRQSSGTLPELEVIISDNSPGEESKAVVDAVLGPWQGRWTYIHNLPGIYMIDNYNQAINRASGRYVIVLSDDDYFLDLGLERLTRSLNAWPDRPAYLFGVHVVDEKERLFKKQCFRKNRALSPKQALAQFISNSSFVRMTGMVLRNDVMQEFGAFDPTTGNICDYDLWIKVFEKYGVYCVAEAVSSFTIHSQALTMTMFRPAVIDQLLTLFDKVAATGLLDNTTLRRGRADFFNQYILAGTYRNLRWTNNRAAAEALRLFEYGPMRALRLSPKWLPLRTLFMLLLLPALLRSKAADRSPQNVIPIPENGPAMTETARTAQVYCLLRILPRYRETFFEQLAEHLGQHGVRLTVLYGETNIPDIDSYAWAEHIPNRTFEVQGRELLWQPAGDRLRGADLIIVEQASRLLLNYLLLAQQSLGQTKLAFWGHGKNFQANADNAMAEWIKAKVSTHAHWWFAYNLLSQRIVEDLGFPSERITNVENAVDTRTMRSLRASIGCDEHSAIRARYDLTGCHTGIYCGRFYKEKRTAFLLEAAVKIHERLPNFELVLIGWGADTPLIEAAAQEHAWIHFVGPKFGREQVELFAVSDLFLMPGLLGLHILDAFALGTPVVTTDIPYHSPEIDYLKSGENGLVTADDMDAYVAGAVALFQDRDRIERFRQDGYRVSEYYTIERMANNFCDGILRALDRPT